ICGFVMGFAASLVTIALARFIFNWLAAPASFGPLPFLAVVVSLFFPMWSDYQSYVKIRRSRKALLRETDVDLTGQIAESIGPLVFGRGVALIGNVFGIILGAYLFLFSNGA